MSKHDSMPVTESGRIELEPFEGVERWIEQNAAFDCALGLCRVPDCEAVKDLALGWIGHHGRSGVRQDWIMRGEGFAVNWMLHTDRHLPETELFMQDRHSPNWKADLFPMSVYIGFHSPVPMNGVDRLARDGRVCEVIGMPCYADGSFSGGDGILEVLLDGGEDAAWKEIHDFFKNWFADSQEAASRLQQAKNGTVKLGGN